MDAHYGHRQWLLQHDGATCHTSQVTQSYLTQFCNHVQNWPAMSSDLNVIENLWSIVKRRVEDLGPQTEEDLINFAFQVWENLSQLEIHRLIDSMPHCLVAVLNNNGFPSGS